MLDLPDRVCIVTGAGQGIGLAVARGLARRGAKVVATSFQTPRCEEAAWCLPWDVADANAADEIVRRVVERFGRVDAMIANAGIYPRQRWDQITDDDWRQVVRVNLDGAWYAAKAAAKAMRERRYGKIVLVSSTEVALGVAVHAHYDAAKAGVIGLTRSLARALGADGIRVNAVMPGAVRTPTERQQFPDADAVDRFCAERQCLPDRLDPEHVEPTFAFLCSGESDAITGQVICVDHGLIHW